MTLPERIKDVPVGWYRYWVDIPIVDKTGNDYESLELCFGNIYGNCQVYFNGKLVGTQSGNGITSGHRPVIVIIPPDAIQYGKKNLVAIRVNAFGGGVTIGINKAPIALSPPGNDYLTQKLNKLEDDFIRLSGMYPDVNDTKLKPARLMRVLETELRNAHKELSHQRLTELNILLKKLETDLASTEVKLQEYWEDRQYQPSMIDSQATEWSSAKGAYGMLGRLYYDGLSLFNSDPAGFSFPFGNEAPYTVRYRNFTPSRIYLSRFNWVAKTMVVEGTRDNKNVSYELTHSSLFPGILLQVHDTQFSFTYTNAHSKAPDYLAYYGKSNNSINISLHGKNGKYIENIPLNPWKSYAPMGKNWFVLYHSSQNGTKDVYPLQVVLESPIENLSISETPDGKVTMTLHSREPINNLVFMYPLGMEPANKFYGNLMEIKLSKDFMTQCDFWGYASRQYPINCQESYKVDESRGIVSVEDQFDYLTLADSWNNGRLTLAPIPPVLSHAVLHNYPVTFPTQGNNLLPDKIDNTRIRVGLNYLLKTKYGEYGAFVGTSKAQYQLPIPSLNESGYLKTQTRDTTLETLLNESIRELAYPQAATGVDRGYKGNTQAWMASSFLNLKNLNRLYQSSTTATINTFDPSIWNIRTEPFSKASYLWSYYLEGPYYDVYDVDWGNALPIYGFQKYATYSGDWKSVKTNWDMIKKAHDHFELGDSWTWMSVSNADLGHGTGAGDCLCSAYVEAIAMARMASVMNDVPTRNVALYRAAKTAVPVLSRLWMNQYAHENKMLTPDQYAIGYFEDEGVLSISSTDDPWYMTSVLSGNGVEPEVFDLYLKYAKDALQEQEVLFDQFYPQWSDGNYRYARSFTYPDNSGYSTLPHIYSRYRLGYSMETIRQYIDDASKTRKMWWVAPNVIAEIASDASPVKLLDWAPMQWVAESSMATGKKVQLVFRDSGVFTTDSSNPNLRIIRIATKDTPVRVSVEATPIESNRDNVQPITPKFTKDLSNQLSVITIDTQGKKNLEYLIKLEFL